MITLVVATVTLSEFELFVLRCGSSTLKEQTLVSHTSTCSCIILPRSRFRACTIVQTITVFQWSAMSNIDNGIDTYVLEPVQLQ
jgi:hypothetical protein